MQFITVFGLTGNDGLIFALATTITSAFGSPVVFAAIVSGLFVLVSKLIERRTKRQSDAEMARLVETQNELLRQVLAKQEKK
jgi:hypothetical protein